jgi:hypothetical protein
VRDPGPGAHVLDVAAGQGVLVAHAVGVRQLPVDHVGDDLHVAVRMGVEPGAGLDQVVVEHPHDAEVDVVGVVVAGEGEVEAAAQPAQVARPQVFALDLPHHQ